jgi:hypothetical protein
MSKLLPRLTHSAKAAALVSLFWLGTASLAEAQNEAVLVLDHSGSMLNRLDGKQKIAAVKDAAGEVIGGQAGKLNLAILAFGTQKSKGCEATETLKALGAIDAQKDGKIASEVHPKGAASISNALKSANELFKTDNGARTIILVSDSKEECKGDPCALAAELKEKSPQTTIHVIAYDDKAEDNQLGLACVAEKTGGLYQPAANAGDLNDALIKAFDLASLGMTEDEAGEAVPVLPEEQVQQPLAPPSGAAFSSNEPGTLLLTAVLAKNTSPLNSGLIWRVYDGQVQTDGSYKLLHRFDQAKTTLNVPPGDYLINASYGRANLTKRITVWPAKQQEEVFDLNAGGLRLYATLAQQPLISDQALSFNVYSDESDQFGNRRKVVTGAKSGVVLRLNSGNYRIESSYGDANSIMEADVKVEPGKMTESTIDHQAGKVTFRLVEKPGGEALADTIWRIYASDGQLVKKSGGAFPTHVLAAGSYSIRVEHGQQEYGHSFAVSAGEKKQVEVVKP